MQAGLEAGGAEATLTMPKQDAGLPTSPWRRVQADLVRRAVLAGKQYVKETGSISKKLGREYFSRKGFNAMDATLPSIDPAKVDQKILMIIESEPDIPMRLALAEAAGLCSPHLEFDTRDVNNLPTLYCRQLSRLELRQFVRRPLSKRCDGTSECYFRIDEAHFLVARHKFIMAHGSIEERRHILSLRAKRNRLKRECAEGEIKCHITELEATVDSLWEDTRRERLSSGVFTYLPSGDRFRNAAGMDLLDRILMDQVINGRDGSPCSFTCASVASSDPDAFVYVTRHNILSPWSRPIGFCDRLNYHCHNVTSMSEYPFDKGGIRGDQSMNIPIDSVKVVNVSRNPGGGFNMIVVVKCAGHEDIQVTKCF